MGVHAAGTAAGWARDYLGTTVTTTPRHDGHGTPRGASRTPATTATGTNDGLPDATVPGNHYFIYLACAHRARARAVLVSVVLVR